MGSDQSTPVGGFRLFKIATDGPADRSGLEVFFDFIIEINGVALNTGANHMQRTFLETIKNAENKEIKMTVYNTRTQMLRDVWIYPTKWSGAGLLGATVRYDLFESAETQGTRVLDVILDSPAAGAGLIAWKDYVLGTPQGFFRDMDEMVEVINNSIGQSLVLMVYSADTEKIREVIIQPRNDWGGQGWIRRSKSNPLPSKRGAYLAQTASNKQMASTRSSTEHSTSPPGEVDGDLTVVFDEDRGLVKNSNVSLDGGRLEPTAAVISHEHLPPMQQEPYHIDVGGHVHGDSYVHQSNSVAARDNGSKLTSDGYPHGDSYPNDTGYGDSLGMPYCDRLPGFQQAGFTGPRPGVIYQASVIP